MIRDLSSAIFGSVLAQNDDGSAKSQTRHSLIYRTPEEIVERKYYRQGDVYQLGIVLYQLLGGVLSYNERDWLSKKEQATYDGLSGYDPQLFATEIIEKRIVKGRILDLESLPPWVCKPLRAMIRKCCSTDIATRYTLVSDLSSALNNLRSRVPDWRSEEHPILRKGRKQLRIVPYRGALAIEKSTGANWRRERTLNPVNLAEAVFMAEGI
jgi:serine/threonine protein kinase